MLWKVYKLLNLVSQNKILINVDLNLDRDLIAHFCTIFWDMLVNNQLSGPFPNQQGLHFPASRGLWWQEGERPLPAPDAFSRVAADQIFGQFQNRFPLMCNAHVLFRLYAGNFWPHSRYGFH